MLTPVLPTGVVPVLPARAPKPIATAEPVVRRPTFQPSAPRGHIEYAASLAKLRSTRGRGWIAIIVIWSATITAGLTAYAISRRRTSWRDYLNGRATLEDVNNTGHLINVATGAQIGAWVLGGVTVAMWARRVAKNSAARGAHNVSVGRATIGWFIPIGNCWIGFGSVRAAVTQLGGSGRRVGLWQGAFLFANVAGFLSSFRIRSLDLAESEADVTNTLNRLLVTSAISLATLAVAAFFGTRAIREVDRVVSDPPPGYLSQAGRADS